jgi:DNA polymerase-4
MGTTPHSTGPSAIRENLAAWHGRAVLHVDMDAFFASVEQLDHPEYRGKPVVVGGSPDKRGVIAAASYEAREFGIRSAMPSAQAARLCPDAIWALPAPGRYSEVSAQVREILGSVTPRVQMVSIDEGYLDVTPGETGEHPMVVARRIQAAVDLMGLSCSVGVATSKVVAKIASDRDKPHGITVVWPDTEAAFLAPLPARLMPGLGPASVRRLATFGIKTLGDVAAMDEGTAAHVLGSWGPSLVRRARGKDQSEVHGGRAAKSVSKERTFSTDIRDEHDVKDAVAALAEQVGARLRRKGMAGRTVHVKVRYADFTTRTAQRTLASATDLEQEFEPVARELVGRLWSPGVGVRLLGVGLSSFDNEAEQLELFEDDAPGGGARGDGRDHALAEGMDAIRAKFGDDAIRRGDRPKGRR